MLVRLVAAVVAAVITGAGAAAAADPAPDPLSRAAILATMKSVDAYWIAHGTDQAANNWQNATFNVGNLAFVTATGVANHYTLPWATNLGFGLATDPRGEFFPDPEATGEVYLDLQAFHPDDSHLAALRARIADEVASVAAGHTGYWNYVDALNMAMPSFARIGVLDHSAADLATMDTLFRYAERRLYDPRAGLWRRSAGLRAYWSRGNGWAAMALAKVLKVLPADDPRRPGYLRVFLRMAGALACLQRPDGFWNVDLGDPTDHPGPETSGTAFFTFALAWGVNQGVLPAAVFRPVVERAWRGLVTTAVRPDGALGYVQGPATGPAGGQPVTATSQAAYGVGGFLLAGAQLAALEA